MTDPKPKSVETCPTCGSAPTHVWLTLDQCARCQNGHVWIMAKNVTATSPATQTAEAGFINQLKMLSDDERAAVLGQFCRVCHKYIDSADWSGANYCEECSPDPGE